MSDPKVNPKKVKEYLQNCITAQELSTATKIAVWRIDSLRRRKKIAFVKMPGGKFLYPRHALDDYLSVEIYDPATPEMNTITNEIPQDGVADDSDFEL